MHAWYLYVTFTPQQECNTDLHSYNKINGLLSGWVDLTDDAEEQLLIYMRPTMLCNPKENQDPVVKLFTIVVPGMVVITAFM